MIRNFRHYLDRLYATIQSRQEITVEVFEVQSPSGATGRTSEIYMRLRFYDGSLLQATEALMVQEYVIVKGRYSYHYQDAGGQLVFRYDNAPHFPALAGFPEHKHLDDRVLPAPAPDLSEVLRQIDACLYPDRDGPSENTR